MYARLLSNRYLTSRLIPLIAIGAVALCVAMVVTVVSVMTGFLDLLRGAGRSVVGDVVVSSGIGGIPHYEELIARINALPECHRATPVIDTFGLLRMPYPRGPEKEIVTTQVWAIEPLSFAEVTEFGKNLYWRRPDDDAARAAMQRDDPRLDVNPAWLEDGRTLAESATGRPGVVIGMHVSVANERQKDGSYRPRYGWSMPGRDVTLTLVPVSSRGKIAEPREEAFPIVNESQSGVYEVDKNRIFAPLAVVQRMLRMDRAPLYDITADPGPDGQLPVIGETPARITKVLARARPGVDPAALRDAIERTYREFSLEVDANRSLTTKMPQMVTVLTWEQQLRDLIAPVQKEREMMRILFSLIYVVCAGLILSIFWAIVIEKTRDIGILRSVGASRAGILWIFLRYGLVIGIFGSVLGVALAWLIVTRINDIHAAIGSDAPAAVWIGTYALAVGALCGVIWQAMRARLLPLLLWTLATLVFMVAGTGLLFHRGTLIWDPSVYYFSHIPDQVDWWTAGLTVIGAVVFSVIGAAIPAARAADTDPVEALRYG
jgi:lipoprotein-releasing system permease protein